MFVIPVIGTLVCYWYIGIGTLELHVRRVGEVELMRVSYLFILFLDHLLGSR